MATVYYTDGRTEEVQPSNGSDFSLEELKTIVEGYIETISLPDKQYIMVINEEGRVNGLPRNEKATQIAQLPTLEELRKQKYVAQEWGYTFIDATMGLEQYIAGTALVCKIEEVK